VKVEAMSRSPQLQVAAYSLPLPACSLSSGLQRTGDYLPLPPDAKSPKLRPAAATLATLAVRVSLWRFGSPNCFLELANLQAQPKGLCHYRLE
jgi:hypothetical protein